MDGIKHIWEYLPPNLSDEIKKLWPVTEIRLRAGRQVIVKRLSDEILLNYKPDDRQIREILDVMTQYSLFAFQDEIKAGFLSLPGGHRVGVCGRVVMEDGVIKTISPITGLLMRVSHQIKGCAEGVMEYMEPMAHTLLISPPGAGKTTLLRDLVRLLSDKGYTVGLVDERSELAGCHMGIAQNDVGLRTDVLDQCPKALGMLMLLRAMSPQIIGVDEIGQAEDAAAIRYLANCGIYLLATVHGQSPEQVAKRPHLCELFKDGMFGRFLVLDRPGGKISVFNQNFEPMGQVSSSPNNRRWSGDN